MSPTNPDAPEKAVDPGELALHLAYAEACIVLMESLMLVLVEKQLVTKSELLDAVESAMDTKKAMANAHWHQNIAPVAAGVLAQISNSLRALP